MALRRSGALLVAALALAPAGASAHAERLVFAAVGTPTVDGVIDASEWSAASSYAFQAAAPGGTTVPGVLFVMTDNENLYVGVRLAVASLHTVSVGFDNDHDGLRSEDGADGFTFGNIALGNPAIFYWDTVLSSRAPCPAGFLCGFRDDEAGGTNDGAGARSTVANETHSEIRHPLDSADDLNDLSVGAGGVVGFALQVSVCTNVSDCVNTQPVPFEPMGDLRIGGDQVPPETAIAAGPTDGSLTSAREATFAVTGRDDVVGPVTLLCAVDDAQLTPCAASVTVATLADGVHRLVARAQDHAGNVDATPASRTWTVDATPPETTFATTPGTTVSSRRSTFVLGGSDALTATGDLAFECALDGGSSAPCASPHVVDGLADGSHTLSVVAADRAGNRDATPARFDWVVDATAPETSLTDGPPRLTRLRVARFAFSGDDALTAAGDLVFQCALDGLAPAPCASPLSLSRLRDGRHRLAVLALDRAGNADGTPAVHAWTVDATPPAKPRVRGPARTANRRPSYRLSSRDALTPARRIRFLCGLDAGPLRRCPSTYRPTVSPGTHVVRVAALDEAGNRSAVARFQVVVAKR